MLEANVGRLGRGVETASHLSTKRRSGNSVDFFCHAEATACSGTPGLVPHGRQILPPTSFN